jgi:hypothetical protein
MAQGTNSSFDAYAQNDISVYPYSTTANLPVTGAISGVFQVLGQAVLTSSSTYAVAMGLVNAAQDGQPINVTTFSGGAGAFTAAVNLLNNVGGSWVTKMINNITYVSPGAFGSLYDNGKANIYTGGLNLLDMAVSATALISNPLMASRSFAAPQCGHDFGCIASYFSNFSSAAGGACSDPGSISQTTPLPTPPSPMYLEDQYWWLRPTGPASDDPN